MTGGARAVQAREALETMVAEADTGGRKPTGISKASIFGVALVWALFQLWYARVDGGTAQTDGLDQGRLLARRRAQG